LKPYSERRTQVKNIDELEAERTMLDRKLRGLKNKKSEIVLSIEEVQDEINKISQKELQMFDGREFQTESFKYVRTASNPSKSSWWQVVKTDNAKPKEVVQVLADIDVNLIKREPDVSAIKRYVAEGRFIVREGGQLIDTETGMVLPYRAKRKADKLTVKAVEA
jgi:t-SNARE complex subunit (syntaxin)